MLRSLLVGFPIMVLCLGLQAVVVTYCLRYYARYRQAQEHRDSAPLEVLTLSVLMLFTMVGNFLQIGIWALLFSVLGEFKDWPTALYHSAVNFSTLGYGDIVMSDRWRLLGPLQAANGILMFGVSSAVMTAAMMDVIKNYRAHRQP